VEIGEWRTENRGTDLPPTSNQQQATSNENKQRVLHLRSSDGIWGPERLILGLARVLPDHGFQIELGLLYKRIRRGMPKEHPLLALARAQGMQAAQLDGRIPLLPLTTWRLLRRLRSPGKRPALLHAHEYKSVLLVGILAQLTGLPAIASGHGLFTRGDPGLTLYRRLELWVLRRFVRVAAVSTAERGRLVRAGVPADRVVVIHNGLDTDMLRSRVRRSRELVRARLGVRSGELVALAIGRLRPVKGHDVLLKAWALLQQEQFPARLWIAGDGYWREWLWQRARELGLGRSVTFLGYRDDVPDLIQAADLVVSASRDESFGLVLLEGMALGRPVVATAVGGVPELVVDGETGLLVPPEDPEALATAVRRLLSDPVLAAQLGMAGVARARSQFSLDATARQLAQLYREALAACVS